MLDYVSLHNHTTFSVGDAIITPNELFNSTKDLGQHAIAVTDHGTMANVLDCFEASKKTGVKFITGIEAYFTDNSRQQENTSLRHIVLLAKNHQGYKNLLTLNRIGFDQSIIFSKKTISRIDWSDLEKYHEGLICTTACGNGIRGQFIMDDEFDKALVACKRLKDIFGDNLAIELQPHLLQRKASYASGSINQQKINFGLKKISEQLDIRAIVATDIHYAKKEDHQTHDVYLCMSSGQPLYSGNRLKYDKENFYPQSAKNIYNHFSRHKNMWGEKFINSLFENTIYFSEQCEKPKWIDPAVVTGEKTQLPDFKIEEACDINDFRNWDVESNQSLFYKKNVSEDARYYRYRTEKGIKQRIQEKLIPEEDLNECIKNCEEEFDVLEEKNFCSYMLIVADYIEWSRKNNIIVGPGRGSVAGSLTAFANYIHEAYPKKYQTIFARFLNKFKDEFPDCDVDFASSGLSKLHAYLKEKYGINNFARISNINSITPKVYARYIAKVFEFGGSRSEAIRLGSVVADSISSECDTIKKALEECPVFAEFVKQFPEIEKYGSLCGKPIAWGTHAAGIIISKRDLVGLAPLRKDTNGAVVIELDKTRCEKMGLIKMDTLGLKELDHIASTINLIKKSGKTFIDPGFDNPNDTKTYDMVGKGDTFGVFQLDKTAVHVCKKLKPKNVSDLSLVTALVRPAAKDIIPKLIAVKNGEREIELTHPALKRSYEKTYGCGLFEECLMFIAKDIAGWGFHEADGFRKMTKQKNKYPEKVAKLREDFIKDSQKNGFTEEMATKIWDTDIASFNGYSFNTSHAVVYSMISYKTAYLKAHFPLEFAVANIIAECHSGAKIAKSNILQWKQMVRAERVKIVPPDINTSEMSYSIIDSKTLMAGLDSLKYMGKDAIPEILSKRPFTSFQDFILRTDSSKVKSTAIASMAASGCLDCFHMDRQKLFYYSADYRAKLKASIRKLHKEIEKEWFKANKNTITKEGKGDDVLYKDKNNNIVLPPVPTKDTIEKCIQSFEYPFPDDEKWTVQEIFALEEFYMGEGLSGTFLERYPGFFTQNSLVFQILKDKYPYVKKSDDLKKDRKANSYRFQDDTGCPIEVVITDIYEFKVKNEESKIFGQIMARIKVQDWMGDELTLVCFPEAWDAAKERIEKSYTAKTKIQSGLAIQVNGMFQWESENSPSIILDTVFQFCTAPIAPKDKKARKVKMPKLNKFIETESENDFEDISKEELAEELESEILFNSDEESSLDEEFNLDDFADPFN